MRTPPPPAPTRLPEDHEALAPLPHPSNADTNSSSGGGGGGGGGNRNPELPHAAAAVAGAEQENRDPSDPFSRWTAMDAKGSKGAGVVRVGGSDGGGEEEPTARGEPPLPKARPAAPRRVSFAPADQVYKLEDPYYGSSSSTNNHQQRGDWEEDNDGDSKEEDYDELEAPRPPPPAPTPMRVSGATGPPRRRLRQTWGTSASSPRGSSSRTRRGCSMDASDDEVFVAPSRMKEPSLWSTAAEQAELERRMAEASTCRHDEFDGRAVPEPAAPAYRAAAAAAVNIHPLAKTFEGLVPVSLDAPPPRPVRKGKQQEPPVQSAGTAHHGGRPRVRRDGARLQCHHGLWQHRRSHVATRGVGVVRRSKNVRRAGPFFHGVGSSVVSGTKVVEYTT
ncbi:unnamed protein product [Ectocarpus fasciculatus]